MKNNFKCSVVASVAMFISVAAFADNIKQFQQSWTGKYDDRKISLFIQSIDQKQVKGYSLLGGNKQNFTGTVKTTSQGYKVTAVESGAKASSGTFTLNLNKNKPTIIDATWESVSGKVKPKYFDLKAQQCRYQKNVGYYAVASSRLLKDDDLHIPAEELDVMRNEIYARHGYSFANRDWARIFADESWYMPCSTNVEAQLTSIEKSNLERIKKVRPYMEKIEWGR